LSSVISFGIASTMRVQYQRVASGVKTPTVSGHDGRVPPAAMPSLKSRMK